MKNDIKWRIIKVLRRELSTLMEKAEQLREELEKYEKKYGMSSQEFVSLWNDAIRRRIDLPFPEEADVELIEWRALYEHYKSLLDEIREIEGRIAELLKA